MRRRSLLFFLLLFVGLGAVTAVYAVSLSGGAKVPPAAAQTDSVAPLEFHPFTMDPVNFDCPTSEHAYWYANYRNCDPVNVIFEGMNVVEVTLALQARGWSLLGLGGIQYLHFANENVPIVQSVQLFLTFGAANELCNDNVLLCRFHIRLWSQPSGQGVIGAVHFEDGGLFKHDLRESWEFAEERVCDDLDSLPRYRCEHDEVFLEEQSSIQEGSTWRANSGFSGTNNKRASLIEREVR